MKNAFRESKKKVDFYSTNCLDFPPHMHEELEVVYIKSGTAVAYCDGHRYELDENTFFLTFPNQVHHYEDAHSGEYILLVVKPSALLSNQELYLKGYPASATWIPAGVNDTTPTILMMALDEYEQNGLNIVVEAHLTAFFEKLIQSYTIQKGKVSSDTVLRILQYCSAHYKEDISIADIANNLHLSRSSVSHIFSLRLGMSFCDHINSLRLNDAMHLLRSRNYSITEISDIAGFPTVRTFNRVFLKAYGMSPSEYRKQMDV